MLKFKNNRYLLMLQDKFQRIVTEEHPELIKDGETLTKIDITKDRLSRYLSSKDEEISIEIKAALFWLHDYWASICMEQSAYNALSGVSCAMASAPTDYSTRSRLVAHVNTFAAYVAMYDPVYREMHKGDQNE